MARAPKYQWGFSKNIKDPTNYSGFTNVPNTGFTEFGDFPKIDNISKLKNVTNTGFTEFGDNQFPKIDFSELTNVQNTGFTEFGDRFANVTIGKDLNVPMYKDLSFFPVLQDGNCALSAIMCQMAEYSHLNFHEKIDFESLNFESFQGLSYRWRNTATGYNYFSFTRYACGRKWYMMLEFWFFLWTDDKQIFHRLLLCFYYFYFSLD